MSGSLVATFGSFATVTGLSTVEFLVALLSTLTSLFSFVLNTATSHRIVSLTEIALNVFRAFRTLRPRIAHAIFSVPSLTVRALDRLANVILVQVACGTVVTQCVASLTLSITSLGSASVIGPAPGASRGVEIALFGTLDIVSEIVCALASFGVLFETCTTWFTDGDVDACAGPNVKFCSFGTFASVETAFGRGFTFAGVGVEAVVVVAFGSGDFGEIRLALTGVTEKSVAFASGGSEVFDITLASGFVLDITIFTGSALVSSTLVSKYCHCKHG